jgi:hypothetical protein
MTLHLSFNVEWKQERQCQLFQINREVFLIFPTNSNTVSNDIITIEQQLDLRIDRRILSIKNFVYDMNGAGKFR